MTTYSPANIDWITEQISKLRYDDERSFYSRRIPEAMDGFSYDSAGRITNPGRFEGEPYFVPFFWGLTLEGLHDEQLGSLFKVVIRREDKMLFPELKEEFDLFLWEDDSGFVHHSFAVPQN